jgi:hypothetical protein
MLMAAAGTVALAGDVRSATSPTTANDGAVCG